MTDARACPHGFMPYEICDECPPPSPRLPRAAKVRNLFGAGGGGWSAPAQYDGHCDGCGLRYYEGDPITRDADGDWVHKDCAS